MYSALDCILHCKVYYTLHCMVQCTTLQVALYIILDGTLPCLLYYMVHCTVHFNYDVQSVQCYDVKFAVYT